MDCMEDCIVIQECLSMENCLSYLLGFTWKMIFGS